MRSGFDRALKGMSVCHTSRWLSPENIVSAVTAVKWFMSVRSNKSNDAVEDLNDERLSADGLEVAIDSGGVLGAKTRVDIG